LKDLVKSSSGASHVAKYTSTEHATREMKTGEEKRLSLEQSHLGDWRTMV